MMDVIETNFMPDGSQRQLITRILHLVIAGDPKSKDRPRFMTRPGGKGTMAYTTKETREAEYALQEAMIEELPEDWIPTTASIAISIRYWLSTARKPDGDNLDKTVWDAATGIVWVDDKQIERWSGAKVQYRSPNPQTEITVWSYDGTEATQTTLMERPLTARERLVIARATRSMASSRVLRRRGYT